MKKYIEYTPEVRAQAVWLVYEHQGNYVSQWAAIESIASRIGCTPEILHAWIRQSETDQGAQSTSDRQRLKELERENYALKQAYKILHKATDYFAQTELERQPKK
ncbi:transposase [Nitrosomonas ureae]|uniref:Transposase n=1 Tax=Nitrosomonas ureae TaxID=44577 RepID=A0A1H5RQ71_9PROT|nr:transposase [Nitrosomonas ureae]SEF40502.1 Transposase [Nitrosomonas ureae]